MTTVVTDVLRQHVLPRLERVRPVGGGNFKASCPVPGHGNGGGDRNPSLSVGPGDTQPVVFNCKAGCHQDDVKTALINLGIDWSLVSERRVGQSAVVDTWLPCGWDFDAKHSRPGGHRKIADYPYREVDGTVRYGSARCVLKGNGCDGFAYWRPDQTSRSGRRWRLNEKGDDGQSRRVVPYLVYRLPEVIHAIEQGRCVYVVEGEKDADRLAALGYPATCNDGGAGKWNEQYATWLTGADVMIVADRDNAGWGHAEKVVNTLLPLARSIEVVRAAHGKDASDHLDAGLRIGQLVQIAEPLPAPTAVPGCPDCAAT